MKKKNSPGNCDCCNCLLYIHWFPDYGGPATINWTDQYTDESAGGEPYYRSKYTAPANHFEIDASQFLGTDFFSDTYTAGSNSDAALNIRLVDPTTPSTVNLALKFYIRDDGFTYATSGSTTTGYRLLKFVCEETTALQSEKVIIDFQRQGPYITTLTGMDLDDWKTDLEATDYTWTGPVSLPIVVVRETHVTVHSSPSNISWLDSEFTDYDSAFLVANWSGTPLYTGAISASKVEIEPDSGFTSGDGNLLVVQQLKDPVGATNATCPQRGCRFIDDYHQQFWNLENLVVTLLGLTITENNTGASQRTGHNIGCGEVFDNTSGGVMQDERTIVDILDTETLPFTITGSFASVTQASVQVITDEFSDATVTTGKVKMRATLSLTYEGTTFTDAGSPLDFDVIRPASDAKAHTNKITDAIIWEWEETRWANNSRPSISLTGADSTVVSTGATEFYALEEVVVDTAPISLAYLTDLFDMVDVTFDLA